MLQAFPQLSETFIENERRALIAMGVTVEVYSIFPPRADLLGPTTHPPGSVRYRPNTAILGGYCLRWTLRRPVVTARNLARALRARSKVMLRGAFWAGWLASAARRDGVTHLHGHFGTEPACAGLPAARLAGLPFTFTIHARDIYLRNRGLDLRVHDADGVVTVCEYNIDQLVERFPTLRREQFLLAYCGVDLTAFGCAPIPPPTASVRVLSVGRLVEKKGFHDLIRAVGLLRAEGLDVSCEIVGHGPLHDELARLIRDLGLVDVVELVGPLAPEAVAERIAACEVFALACRIDESGDRDSMPVVLKEAMATCRPVVSTKTVGIPELVTDDCGLLVEPSDPVALAGAIRHLIDVGPERRAAMGRAGRARVDEHFNLITETAKLKGLVERLG